MGQPLSQVLRLWEDGEVWPPRFELAKHLAGTSTLTQDSLDPSTPMQDGHQKGQATTDLSDVTPMPREVARRLTWFYRGGAAQANVALNRQSTKAEGGNQKAPTNQEQKDSRFAAGARTNLQAGRGTPHDEDGLLVIGDANFIRVQVSIQRHLHRELDAEQSCSSGRVVSSDQQ
jgi:hypothetical protein